MGAWLGGRAWSFPGGTAATLGRAPELTALRRARPGRVALEVDGRPWRIVPDEVVLRAGLLAGMELERPVLRRVRAELRRAEARAVAGRALARRDLSATRLGERLEQAGISEAVANEAVAALARAHVVDDARTSCARARALVRRGYGDAAIAAQLEAEAFDAASVRGALAELPPERERAEPLLRPADDPAKAARRLAQRGFAPETIEDVVGALDA